MVWSSLTSKHRRSVLDSCYADQSVVATAHRAVIDIDTIAIFCLEEVSLEGSSLPSGLAMWHENILVIVRALLQKQGFFILSSLGIEAHAALLVQYIII